MLDSRFLFPLKPHLVHVRRPRIPASPAVGYPECPFRSISIWLCKFGSKLIVILEFPDFITLLALEKALQPGLYSTQTGIPN